MWLRVNTYLAGALGIVRHALAAPGLAVPLRDVLVEAVLGLAHVVVAGGLGAHLRERRLEKNVKQPQL